MLATILPNELVTPDIRTRSYGVLVADDERETRDALEWGLQREGFSVWLAADGREAVEQYRQYSESIDVLLLDIDMPRLDGPAAWAVLQRLTPQIPCCFMSGQFGDDSPQRLRDRGAREVVAKPFQVPELAQMLRTLARAFELDRNRRADARRAVLRSEEQTRQAALR